MAGCDRKEEALRNAIGVVDSRKPETVETVVSLCNELGELADQEVRDSLETCSEGYRCQGLREVLVQHDLDGNLRFLVETVAASDAIFWFKDEWQGHIGHLTRRRLHEMAEGSSDRELAVILGALSLVADDEESLRLAKSVLERNSDPSTTIAALGLLAAAAYYQDDPSAITWVLPHLSSEDTRVRLNAFTALTVVPGEGIEDLIKEEGFKAGMTPSVVDKLLTNRRANMTIVDRCSLIKWPAGDGSVDR